MNRQSLCKIRKVPGGGLSNPAISDKDKVKLFLNMFERIREQIGNYEVTRARVRASNNDMVDLHKLKRISIPLAKRILSLYESMFTKGE